MNFPRKFELKISRFNLMSQSLPIREILWIKPYTLKPEYGAERAKDENKDTLQKGAKQALGDEW